MIVRLDIESAKDRPLRQVVTIRSFEGFRLMSGEADGTISRRTKELLADGNDDFIFTTSLSGACLPSHAGREITLETGEAILQSAAEICSFDFPEPVRFVALCIPRRSLANLVAEPEKRADAADPQRFGGAPPARQLYCYDVGES